MKLPSPFIIVIFCAVQVDELGEQLEANRWKKYYYSQENSDYIKQRERDIPKYYVGETLADRTQRERQLQLENQIAGSYVLGFVLDAVFIYI